MNAKFQIKRDKDFIIWYLMLSEKEQSIISNRLDNISEHGHFGDFSTIDDKLYELRWKNGLRIYFVKFRNIIILLNGGYKNDQKKDIKKAKVSIKRYL